MENTETKPEGRSNRSRLIGLIHCQKSALGLSDEEYRIIVRGATEKTSCSDCDMTELFKVFDDLNTLLEQNGKTRFYFKKQEGGAKASFQDSVIFRAKKVFGETWFARLQGFLKSKGKTSLSDCDSKDLRQIMGWISAVQRRSRNGTKNGK